MSFWSFIARLFGWSRPEPEPEPVESPTEKRTPTDYTTEVTSPITSGTDPRFVIPIYQTQGLADMNGRAPEKTLARYLHRALDRAASTEGMDLSHAIYFGFEPLNIEVPPLRNFRDYALPQRTQYNIVLTEQNGNGATIREFFDGRGYAWKGMGRVDRFLDHVWEGEQKIDANVHGGLHEFLHLAGVGHDENPDAPGNQYPGDGEQVSDCRWARTPMAASQTENACGEPVDPEPDMDDWIRVRRQYFSPCEIEHIET